MLAVSRSMGGKLLATLVVAGLVLPPAFAAGASDSKRRPPAVALSLDNISAFTPAMADPRLAAAASANTVGALTPASYNLGVAVGWRRFAVSGDVAKVKAPNPALSGREGALVGVSYSLKKFTGRVAVGADRSDGQKAAVLADPDNYSLDVGGAYSITRNIAVTGGVRYKIERDRLSTLADQRRDSQAVYVGTAFKF